METRVERQPDFKVIKHFASSPPPHPHPRNSAGKLSLSTFTMAKFRHSFFTFNVVQVSLN
jgi:hypothetical protein